MQIYNNMQSSCWAGVIRCACAYTELSEVVIKSALKARRLVVESRSIVSAQIGSKSLKRLKPYSIDHLTYSELRSKGLAAHRI
jgi:hypothetical protein